MEHTTLSSSCHEKLLYSVGEKNITVGLGEVAP
jgi:hypothetical protein